MMMMMMVMGVIVLMDLHGTKLINIFAHRLRVVEADPDVSSGAG